MRIGTKPKGPGGRPRKFDEAEVVAKIQRQLWTTGLSRPSLDDIARSAGLNRPSLAAAFGDKDAIYAQAAAQYVAMMDARMKQALDADNLEAALQAGFDTAIDIYTAGSSDGCFVLCTAPAETQTSPACRTILNQALEAIDAAFLRRLEREQPQTAAADLPVLAAQLGATIHSVSLRARAGWSADRLRAFAAGSIHQVLVTLGRTSAA